MRKLLLPLLAATLVVNSCTTSLPKDVLPQYVSTLNAKPFTKAYKSLSEENMKKHLYVIASPDMEGRDTGSPGIRKAADYITKYYQSIGISHPKQMKSYFQTVPSKFMKGWGGKTLPDSDNILAYIEGSEKPDELIVLSAHYDHVGTKNGVVYPGADDDGSGTVAIMELAKAFQTAKVNGDGPKRSILFLLVTGEEHGLFGSDYYSKNPVFPLKNTVANLNIDMIGRDDPENRGKNYVYVIGSDMLSSEIKKINEAANKLTNNLELNYKYDDPKDPMRLYYRSDHYNFAKNGIPVAFYFDGIHEDYHKPTDTPDKIDYKLLLKRTQLVFATAWELANRENRVVVDGTNKR